MSVPGHLVQGMANMAQTQQTAGYVAPAAPVAAPQQPMLPASQRPLPTQEQMHEPYNVSTDPRAHGSVDESIKAGAQGIDPREQGQRLAQARQDQQAQLALERAQYLEQQNADLLQQQQAQATQLANLQGQVQQVTQAPAQPQVDPLAQYNLTLEEREALGDQLPIVEKMMAGATAAANLKAQQDADARVAALTEDFKNQLAPVQQSIENTQKQTANAWNEDFVASVRQEMQLNLNAMKGDPAWEHFIATEVPHTGGSTYGQQLVAFIQGQQKEAALNIVRAFHGAQAQQQQGFTEMQASPGAAPVYQQQQTRPVQAPVGAADPAQERMQLTMQYKELTDKLGRQEINIPEFQTAVKPIDDRLAELSRAT